MATRRAVFLATLLAVLPSVTFATDACSPRALVTEARVSVSDGTSFTMRTWFQSRAAAALRQSGNSEVTVAIDGPTTWSHDGSSAQAGNAASGLVVLGHQLHAALLYFNELANDVHDNAAIRFAGESRHGKSGDLGNGGRLHLVAGGTGRAAGLVIELPDGTSIEVAFSDWKAAADGMELPFAALIDDGTRRFDYRFVTIETHDRSPLWYFDAVPAPPLDDVAVYRLHRRLLAAHCLGDADMMAEWSVPEPLIASRGELQRTTRETVRERFAATFERIAYREYIDLVPPVIHVAEAGDSGWIAVNVRARGEERSTGRRFDDRWAWVMMVRKVDGRWLHAGNASNRAE